MLQEPPSIVATPCQASVDTVCQWLKRRLAARKFKLCLTLLKSKIWKILDVCEAAGGSSQCHTDCKNMGSKFGESL